MTTGTPPWTPPDGPGTGVQPAGLWWDAVKVPAVIAARALDLLGEEDRGPVVEDPYGAVWYWLVPPGAAADWTIHRVLARGSHLALPPRGRVRGPGPHWRVAPDGRGGFTDAERLHTALRAANACFKVCLGCQRLTDEPVELAVIHGAGAGRTHYACPACAPRFPRRRDPLVDPAAVRRAIGERRTWRAAIVHLTECADCRASDRGCAAGRRLLRAHRAALGGG
ncbi:hypothetical protein [Streptomyces sp. SAJ15]|uniref:hypothetical protein n=1 Tax=Streptomyces sp. SAJ15 TaxID=2011095 RepID=UPI0016430235|nr:hypothetical protein [Streptomyces sp. SAJ15]